MKFKNILLFSLLALTLNVSIYAGYLSRYNHPEIKWRYLKSGDFIVFYSQNDSIEAQRVLDILVPFEDSVDFVLGAPKGPVSVVLNNYDMMSNGMANSIGDVINIYTHPFYTVTTGNIDWLRRVARHEFSHIATYKALSLFNWTPLRIVTMTTIPQWFYEGIAQYCAETEDGNRRMFVREGIKNKTLLDFNFLDQTAVNDLIDGRDYYEEGHGIVRMEMEKDSTYLKRILKAQSVLGLFLPFHVNYLIATGHLAYGDFKKWILSRREHLKSDSFPVYNMRKTPFKYMKGFKRNDSIEVYAGFNDLDIPANELVCFSGRKKIKIDDNVGAYFDLSPDGDKITYSKKIRDKNGTILEDIMLFNIKNKSYTRITQYEKATNPAFVNDSIILYTKFFNGKGELYSYDLNSGKERSFIKTNGNFVYDVTPSCYGNKVAFEEIRGVRYIKITDGNGETSDSIYSTSGECRHPYFADDSTIYFTGYFSGRPEVYRYNLNTKKYYRETEAFSGHFQPYVYGDTLFFIDYHGKRGFSLEYRSVNGSIYDTQLTTKNENNPLPEYNDVKDIAIGRYNSLKNLKVIGFIPLPVLDFYHSGFNGNNYYMNPRLIVAGMISDPLLKNVLYGFVGSNIFDPTPTVYFNYMNSSFYPTINISYMRIPYISNYYPNSGRFTYFVEENGMLMIDLPVIFSNNIDKYAGVTFSYNYRREDTLHTSFYEIGVNMGKGKNTFNDDVLLKNNISISINDKLSDKRLFCNDDYNLLSINVKAAKPVNARIINHFTYSFYYASGSISKTSLFIDKRHYGGFPDYDIPQRLEIGTDVITGRNIGKGISFITLPYINQISFGVFSDNYCFYKISNGDFKYRSFLGLRTNIKLSYYYLNSIIEGGLLYDITRNYIGHYITIGFGINGI